MPLKPWTGVMTYNGNGGEMLVVNMTFANFGANTCGSSDAVFVNSKNNDDGQHPIKISNSKVTFFL